jgi:hypothetical protein
MKSPNLPAVAIAALLFPSLAEAQVPNLVNYQGRVAVGTTNFEGAGQFRFALVNPTGNTVYWGNAPDTAPADGVPDAAVSLTVTKGLYSVLLGDTTIASMAAIPASVWTNPDVRLRVWFNNGINGNQLLTPDQRLAPTGYLAAGSVNAAQLAEGAITAEKINNGAVTSNKFGNDVGLWSLGGANVFRSAGNVGIGTMTPGETLTVVGSGSTDASSALSVFNSSLGSLLRVRNDGSVGIGTTTPGQKLDVVGVSQMNALELRAIGSTPYLDFSSTTADYNARIIYSSAGNVLSVQGASQLIVEGEVTCVAVNLTSDRNAKEQFTPVNPRAVLDKVVRLPITEWQYKTQRDARHIGPMAQDFREAFALGRDERHITSVDADGVALAAIQGLNQKLEEAAREKDAVISRLLNENQHLAERLSAIEALLQVAPPVRAK